ncbi:MAG: peptidase, partial [Celeribacter marinus]
AADLSAALDHSVAQLGTLKAAAEAGFSYDQMLARGNVAGEALIMGAVDALVAQTRDIERAVTVLTASAIEVEGSDSLDNPNAVFE